MIQSVIDGIIESIRSEYPVDKYEIYTESVEQGLKEPCFSILCISPSSEQKSNDRYVRTFQMIVRYFPESKDEYQSECNEVSEVLFDILNEIFVEGCLVHGFSCNSQIVDGVLQFPITYSIHVLKEGNGNEDSFEEYSIGTNVRRE